MPRELIDAKEALKAVVKKRKASCGICSNPVVVKRLTELIKADVELVAEGNSPVTWSTFHLIMMKEKIGFTQSVKTFQSGHMARWRDGTSSCGKAHD